MDYEIGVVNVPSYLRVVFMMSAADFGVAQHPSQLHMLTYTSYVKAPCLVCLNMGPNISRNSDMLSGIANYESHFWAPHVCHFIQSSFQR